MKPILYVENEQGRLDIDSGLTDVLKQVVERVLDQEGIAHLCEVTISFVDKAQMQALNSEHRGKDLPTDVLSFPMAESPQQLEEDPETGAYLLGDIVICTSIAMAQSVEYGHSVLREIAFLTVHAMLHLLGYDHVDSEEAYQQMMDKGEQVLASLGITRDQRSC